MRLSVAEGDPATFTVALAGGTSTGDVVVAYSVDGTATAGDDYKAPDGILTIEMGEASGTITIVTGADKQVEDDETLTVTLDSATTVGRRDGGHHAGDDNGDRSAGRDDPRTRTASLRTAGRSSSR